MNPKIKIALAFSIIPQLIFVKWFGNYPDLVEKYYSEGIYPAISNFLRLLFGWIPFSMGDIFYTLAVFALLRYLYYKGKLIFKKPLAFLQDLGITLSIAYFIFHLFWGLNYYRIPIQEKIEINANYNAKELEDFTRYLVKETNRLQLVLAKNDSTQKITIPYSQKKIFIKTQEGYSTLVKSYPQFNYKNKSLKKSLFSLPLTYMGYGGYLNPFTNEAQVNAKMPILKIPTVSGHEAGHQLGYSSESATNFVGLLVTVKNKDLYFKYAAYSNALGYCLNDLRQYDQEKSTEIIESLHPGVRNNYREITVFWQQYENPTEPIFKWAFNAFLKANNQADGIKSYNAVVGLLIGYHNKHGF